MIASRLLHLLLLLLLPPLLPGVIARTKAWFAGRHGPPLLQPYLDLVKLMRKGWVLSTTATWIFRAGPAVTLIATFTAGLLVPLAGAEAPLSFPGDLVLLAYLFALARFFTIAAALDTGSAFEGMGAAREATFACFSEPALFFALMGLARQAGSLRLADLLAAAPAGGAAGLDAPTVLIAISLFLVLLAETCRIPVDDPTTHLELTMIHEAMVLDHSGPLFGAILYASAMKLLVLGALLVRVVAPAAAGNPAADAPLFLLKLIGLAAGIGVVESVTARLRLRRVPFLLVAALLASGFGFILMIR